MKKLRWLVVLAAMLFTTAANADGVDVKVKGEWDFAFGWANNTNFRNNRDSKNTLGGGYRDDDNFIARQRIRTQINFIASEHLQGVLMFEIGDIDWGNGGDNANSKVGQGSGGNLDADGVNVETKRAYLDWLIPNTEVSVRMGIQGVSLPMANGYCNPVFSADVAGIVVNTPITDMVGVTAFWLRPFNQNLNDGANTYLNDEMDMVGLTLPITGDGWSVIPWGMYSRIGNAAGYYEYIGGYGGYDMRTDFNGRADDNAGTNAWWGGISTQIDIWDPLSFGFDVMYGHLGKADIDIWNSHPASLSSEFGTRGWFAEAALNYKLDWGTPGIFGWYSSGDDYDDVKDGQFGRIPVVGVDDGFGPTSFGFPGGYNIGTDSIVGMTAVGTWGVGLQLAEMSFIEDLSHTLRVAYYRGTNDSDVVKKWNRGDNDGFLPHTGAETVYLTTKDRAWEVNFDHQYQIYENLTTVLELGYINLHLDDDTWKDHKTDDAWKAQVLFKYQF